MSLGLAPVEAPGAASSVRTSDGDGQGSADLPRLLRYQAADEPVQVSLRRRLDMIEVDRRGVLEALLYPDNDLTRSAPCGRKL